MSEEKIEQSALGESRLVMGTPIVNTCRTAGVPLQTETRSRWYGSVSGAKIMTEPKKFQRFVAFPLGCLFHGRKVSEYSRGRTG
jgi:hypothetical protein